MSRDRDHEHKDPVFDPDLEYLLAAVRDGQYLPAIKHSHLLDKLATIFEAALDDHPPAHR